MRELRNPGPVVYRGTIAVRPGSRWRRALPRRRDAAPYLLDLAGWAAGAALAAAGLAAGWAAPVLLLAILGLAGAEAARQAALRAAAERRLADFGRVRRAGERMIAPARELDAVVARFADECANVVGCHWFQLELDQPAGPGGEARRTVWSAGPDRALAEGAAWPDPYPPALPGVHRRAVWRVLERSLGAQDGASARLTLWCDPRRLAAEDLELLEALLPQMAASLHQGLLDREAREDPLTGAAVRRVLDRRLHAAWAEACEGGGALAVILADVDRFKAINDTWGHAAGDVALAAVAAALAAGKREADLLARFGGEEFALLLEKTDGAEALAIAERLRRRVAEVELETDDGPLPPLSISAGVASFPELTVKTAGELLLLADEALYEAKERGRDRCLLHRGRGRFLTADGAEIGETPDPSEPRAPRLFA
jgi:diguanylate cyclase (GGDEF)-like protein